MSGGKLCNAANIKKRARGKDRRARRRKSKIREKKSTKEGINPRIDTEQSQQPSPTKKVSSKEQRHK